MYILRGRNGTMKICEGSAIRPGVPWVPPFLRGRCVIIYILHGRYGTMCTVKESDVRPGVPWAPPFLYGRRGTIYIAKGVGCMPWRPLGSASFVWAAAPVEGVLMIIFNIQLPTFFLGILLSTGLEAGATVRSVHYLNHY